MAIDKTEQRNRYFDILCDFDYDNFNNQDMAKVVGVAVDTLRIWRREFDWEEITNVRRQRLAKIKPEIDKTVVKEALKGKLDFIKLFYERFDGWVPKQRQEYAEVSDERELEGVSRKLKQLLSGRASTNTVLNGEKGANTTKN